MKEAGLVEDGPGLPDDDPVGLLLDVSDTVFVPVVAVPALALADSDRAAEAELDRDVEEDMEIGPPVGEEVVAVEEVTEGAAFAGTNPMTKVSSAATRKGTQRPTNTIPIDIENSIDVLQKSITQQPSTRHNWISVDVASATVVDLRANPIL